MRTILNIILDLLAFIYNFLKGVAIRIIEKFLEINIFEKGIIGNTLLAMIAEILPVAQYYIFKSYRDISNPIVHYMVGIAMIMLITIYFPGIISTGLRVAVNIFYLIYIIYLGQTHSISYAPYELTAGYYINIIVPIIYIVLSLLSFILFRED